MCCRSHDLSSSVLKLKAIDASFIAQKKTLADVSEIDKQSKLLLRPHRNGKDETTEFTL